MAVPDRENHRTGKITESSDIPLSRSPAKLLPDFLRRFSGHSSSTAGLLQAVSVPTSSAQPSSSQPSSSTEGVLVPLNSDDVSRHPCLLTLSKIEETKALLTERVEFQTRRPLENEVDRTRGEWIGIHLDSIKAPLSFPFSPFLLVFLEHYKVLPGQVGRNAHRIIACFSQIYARHNVSYTMELFNFIFTIWHIPLKHGGGFLMAQSRGHFYSIPDLPDNNKGWKNRIISIKYTWELPVPRA